MMAAEGGRPRCMVVLPRLNGPETAGDGVVFRHVLERLGLHLELDKVEIGSVGWMRRLLNLVLFAGPPELARHIGRPNRDAVAEALDTRPAEVICFLHEGGFTALGAAKERKVPAVLYPHNVHSVVARTDDSLLGRLFGPASAAFERRWYGDPYASLVCISEADARALRAAGIHPTNLTVAPPGAPPSVPLQEGAPVLDQILLTGSHGWWRKRRHLLRFAWDPGRLRTPILVTDSTAKAALGEQARLVEKAKVDWSEGLRFGLIVDGFTGGFKLKALEYVALNCLVLSYCDLSPEFEDLPHSREFIRRISSKADVVRIVAEVASEPPAELIRRFLAFKEACLERYDWDHSIDPLLQAILSRARGANPLSPGNRADREC